MIQIVDLFIYILENFKGTFLTQFVIYALVFWIIRLCLNFWKYIK